MMRFYLTEKDLVLMNFWGQRGYDSAVFDQSIGITPEESRILPHMSYFEFIQDLSSIDWTDKERLQFYTLRPLLLRSYVKGYRYFAERNQEGI